MAKRLTIAQSRLTVITDRINDTTNLAGIEALSGSLAYYNAVKKITKNIEGAATIYEDVSKRFPSKCRKTQII